MPDTILIGSNLDNVYNGSSGNRGMLTSINYARVSNADKTTTLDIKPLRVTPANKAILKEAFDLLDKEDQELSRIKWTNYSLVFFEGRNVTARFIKKIYEVEQAHGIETELPYEFRCCNYKKYSLGGLVTDNEKFYKSKKGGK